MDHFTAGLSAVFRHYAAALKPGAPFVFTYHHNDPTAYLPLVVAILDAGMGCTASLPAAAEMSASLHIAGTSSSVLDSVFVCRAGVPHQSSGDIAAALGQDVGAMKRAGLRITEGDIRCLAAGHVARDAVNRLRSTWDSNAPLSERMAQARKCLAALTAELRLDLLVTQLLTAARSVEREEEGYAATV